MFTLNLKVTSFTSHGVSVDLTHVPASVNLLDVGDVELPLLVLPVGEGDPLVPGDDAVVDGEDSLCVYPHPSNLICKYIYDFNTI